MSILRLFCRLAALGAGLVALLGFVSSSAAAVASDATVPFTQDTTNPCNGDAVTITGYLHIVIVMNDNKAEIQTNWPDTSGVDAVHGTRYQANDASHTSIVPVSPTDATFTFQDNYELISQGTEPNFLMHEYISIDVGSGTIIKMRGEPECTG